MVAGFDVALWHFLPRELPAIVEAAGTRARVVTYFYQVGRKAGRSVGQTVRQAGRQAGRQACRQAGKQASKQASLQASK